MMPIGDLRNTVGIFKGFSIPDSEYRVENNKHFIAELFASIREVRGNRQRDDNPAYGDELSYSHVIVFRAPEFFQIDTQYWIAENGRFGVRWWRVHSVSDVNERGRYTKCLCRLYENNNAREDGVKPNMSDAY